MRTLLFILAFFITAPLFALTTIQGQNFDGQTLSEGYTDTVFKNCSFKNTVFQKGLSKLSFEKCFLDGAVFDTITLEDIRFPESSLIFTNFKSSNLKNVSFDDLDIRFANFEFTTFDKSVSAKNACATGSHFSGKDATSFYNLRKNDFKQIKRQNLVKPKDKKETTLAPKIFCNGHTTGKDCDGDRWPDIEEFRSAYKTYLKDPSKPIIITNLRNKTELELKQEQNTLAREHTNRDGKGEAPKPEAVRTKRFDFSKLDFSGFDLSKATFIGVDFNEAHMFQTKLSNAHIENCAFGGANLVLADFNATQFIGDIAFKNALLHGANFKGTHFDKKLGTYFIEAPKNTDTLVPHSLRINPKDAEKDGDTKLPDPRAHMIELKTRIASLTQQIQSLDPQIIALRTAAPMLSLTPSNPELSIHMTISTLEAIVRNLKAEIDKCTALLAQIDVKNGDLYREAERLNRKTSKDKPKKKDEEKEEIFYLGTNFIDVTSNTTVEPLTFDDDDSAQSFKEYVFWQGADDQKRYDSFVKRLKKESYTFDMKGTDKDKEGKRFTEKYLKYESISVSWAVEELVKEIKSQDPVFEDA